MPATKIFCKQLLLKAVCAGSLFAAMCANAATQHTLILEKSSLNFLSTKNTHVTEKHSFDTFSGTLTKAGELSIEIDLSSVNTIIPIRNERMRKMLFAVSDFPTATFSAKLDPSKLPTTVGTRAVFDLSRHCP